jgi:hypothetical protein
MTGTTIPTLLALTLSTCALVAPTARAQTASGLQMTPDSRRYLISKDVGAERWAISFNLDDRTVTGNVFKTDGSEPSFIWCRITSETPAPDPRQTSYLLDCFGADACAAAPCGKEAWTRIASGLRIGGDFLLPDGTQSTFRGNVQPIFAASCTAPTCHAGASPADELSLEPAVAYGNLFLRRPEEDEPYLVEPFAPDTSLLFLRVAGTTAGERMPLGTLPLPDAQVAAIRNWILEGAADN